MFGNIFNDLNQSPNKEINIKAVMKFINKNIFFISL